MPLSRTNTSIIVAVITAVGSLGTAWITASQGYVSFPNPALQRKVDELTVALENRSELSGDFEWQWTGDNWLGSVKFQKLADGRLVATTDMRMVKPESRTGKSFENIRAFQSDIDGSASIGKRSMISLHLPVLVTPEYRKIHHVTSTHINIDAELQPVDAFAGRARYGGAETPTGDIIL